MSKTLAIVQLLQHGPLSLRDIVDIGGAGWNAQDTSVVLWRLQQMGRVERRGGYRGSYRLIVDIHDAERGLWGCRWRCSPAARARQGAAT